MGIPLYETTNSASFFGPVRCPFGASSVQPRFVTRMLIRLLNTGDERRILVTRLGRDRISPTCWISCLYFAERSLAIFVSAPLLPSTKYDAVFQARNERYANFLFICSDSEYYNDILVMLPVLELDFGLWTLDGGMIVEHRKRNIIGPRFELRFTQSRLLTYSVSTGQASMHNPAR